MTDHNADDTDKIVIQRRPEITREEREEILRTALSADEPGAESGRSDDIKKAAASLIAEAERAAEREAEERSRQDELPAFARRWATEDQTDCPEFDGVLAHVATVADMERIIAYIGNFAGADAHDSVTMDLTHDLVMVGLRHETMAGERAREIREEYEEVVGTLSRAIDENMQGEEAEAARAQLSSIRDRITDRLRNEGTARGYDAAVTEAAIALVAPE